MSKSSFYRRVRKRTQTDLAEISATQKCLEQVSGPSDNFQSISQENSVDFVTVGQAFESFANDGCKLSQPEKYFLSNRAFQTIENDQPSTSTQNVFPEFVCGSDVNSREFVPGEPNALIASDDQISIQDIFSEQSACGSDVNSGIEFGPDDRYALVACVGSESSKDDEQTETFVFPLKDRLTQWALGNNIKRKAFDQLLQVLHFEHPNLPRDSRTLFGTSNLSSCPTRKMGVGSYVHYGLAFNLATLLSKLATDCSELSLSFNIDGQSPYRHSKKQMWPILCRVHNLSSNPLLIGAWYGRTKPEPETFLQEFLNELGDLLTEGLFFKDKHFSVKLHSFICDSPAVAYIKCTKGHGGFYGCQKCVVRGSTIDHCRVFHDLNAELRNNRNFRLQKQPEHHKGDSPILSTPADMVADFPLDVMHLIYLGVVKRLCSAWKEGVNSWTRTKIKRRGEFFAVWSKKKGKTGKLSRSAVQTIDAALEGLRKYWPSDFARFPGSLSDSDSWKATQARTFLLYAGPVVLKGVLDKERYEHFLYLHAGMRILAADKLCELNIQKAEQLLRAFVSKCPSYYGPAFTVYNVHSVIHLGNDCRKFGPVESFSAFPFENFQGVISRLLRGQKKPLEQLWYRLKERNNLVLHAEQPEKNIPVVCFSKKTTLPTGGLKGAHASKVFYLGTEFSLKQTDNCMVLQDGAVIKAVNFIKVQDEVYVVGKLFSAYNQFYERPCKSSDVNISVVSRMSEQIFVWKMTNVVGKVLLLPCKHKFVAIKALHYIH